MAGWNGSGTFVRAYNWVADKLASIKINASRMDGEFDNYKSGLENCLTRDGQTPPTGDINWNSKKITSLANGTASTDAINLSQLAGVTTGNTFRKNLLINGGFDVWQSGAGGSASIAGTAARIRTADCWWAIRQGTTGYTVSQQTGTVNRYALKWQRDNGNASTQNMIIAQSIETANVVRLKRGTPPTCYLSFYAKKGANYSGGNLTVEVVRGTGTDENVLDTYTGATVLATVTVSTLTTSQQRFSGSVPIDTSTNELGVRFTWTPTGAAGADDSITLENVQLEVANAPTDFEYLPFDDVLRRCRRYFQKSFPYSSAPQQNFSGPGSWYMGAFKAGAAASPAYVLPLPVTMRSPGTPVSYNPAAASSQVRDLTAAANTTGTSISCDNDRLQISFTGAAGTAVGNTMWVDWSIGDNNF